jgi:hypothetical protein
LQLDSQRVCAGHYRIEDKVAALVRFHYAGLCRSLASESHGRVGDRSAAGIRHGPGDCACDGLAVGGSSSRSKDDEYPTNPEYLHGGLL